MTIRNWAGVILAPALALSACANVYSSKDLKSTSADTNGLTYALPTTWLEIKARRGKDSAGGGMVIDFSTHAYPDGSHIYSLDHVASAFAHDQITIEVGEDQLLKKVDTTTEDVTDQIIIGLAKAVSGVASFSLPPVGIKARGVEYACSAPPDPPWSVIIDPFNDKTWPRWLNKGCLTLTPITQSVAPATDETRAAERCTHGICHRAPIPYRIAIDLGPAGTHEFVTGLLNKSPILSIDVNRTMFVEKKMDLEFTSGVLTKVVIDSPSPMLEFVSLPVDVAKAIFSAPAELLKLRVDYSSQAIADRKKEEELIKTNRDYQDFIRNLSEEKTDKDNTEDK